MKRPAETAIAAPLLEHLRAQGWELFSEVRHAGARCDIAAKRPDSGYVMAIEAKRQVGFDVIGQAARWRDEVNWSAICTPPVPLTHRAQWIADLAALKLGWFVVDGRGVRQLVAPPLLRPEIGALSFVCRAEHQQFGEAGSRDDYYTPKRASVAELEALVREHPHCSVKFAAEQLPHLFKAPDQEGREKQLRRAAKRHELGAVRTINWRLYLEEKQEAISA